jgi:hypothetical protein
MEHETCQNESMMWRANAKIEGFSFMNSLYKKDNGRRKISVTLEVYFV